MKSRCFFAMLYLTVAAVSAAVLDGHGHLIKMLAGQQCRVSESVVQRFSDVLQYRTVSDRDAPEHVVEPEQFKALHTYLEQAYPEVWSALTVEQVGEGGLSLLLTWPGAQPELSPLLLISHLDVVPVAAQTLDQWTHPPFSGAVDGGFVYGRGSLDVKIGVVGLLEAATLLLQQGWRPQRTLLFGFGQDEEVGGDLGAGRTAALLLSRGITSLDAVVDEGSTVQVDGFYPYTTQPVALVSTAEKGYFSVKVRITTPSAGHSSVPPLDHTSAAALAARVVTLLDEQPPPAALVPPVTDWLRAVAPLVDTPWLRALFASPEQPGYAQRILEGHLLVDTPLTAAMAHTTVAVTGLDMYVGDNVLPPTADINVNFRLLPGDTVDGEDTARSVMAYLRSLLGDDLQPYVSFMPVRPDATREEVEATPVTSAAGRHFRAVKQALQETWVFDGKPVTVAPFMLTGGTDSRHYMRMADGGILRFVPVGSNRTAGDDKRVHGLNERLAVPDLLKAVCTYRRALQLLAAE